MSPLVAAAVGAAVSLLLVGLALLLRLGSRRRAEANQPPDIADLAKLIASIGMAGLLVGEKDEVFAINEAGAAIGLGRGARVGYPGLLQLVRQVRRDQVPFRGTLPTQREAGKAAVELAGSVIPLRDGLVVVFADDQSASQRVEEMRRDFVANISHELKTPVGAIGILAEAIEAAADDPAAVARFIGRLQRESRRLNELLAQVIELSRLQSADVTSQYEVVAVDDIVTEAIERSREVARNREVNLVRGPSSALRLLGDRRQLADALTNLVHNAVIYSGKRARVVISVSQPALDGDEMVDIKVADNGIGIAAEDLERIFERFYRVDYARSRENGGTGLGLSIVQHIAIAHGGDVTVWSEPQQGSTFTLRLPVYVGHESEGVDDAHLDH